MGEAQHPAVRLALRWVGDQPALHASELLVDVGGRVELTHFGDVPVGDGEDLALLVCREFDNGLVEGEEDRRGARQRLRAWWIT